MDKEKRNQLRNLLAELINDRLAQLDDMYPDAFVYDMRPEDLYELDEHYRVIESCDTLIDYINDVATEK